MEGCSENLCVPRVSSRCSRSQKALAQGSDDGRTFINPRPSALQAGSAAQQDLRQQAGLVPTP